MDQSSSWAEGLSRLALLFSILALYVGAATLVYRRWRRVGLITLWIGVSLLAAYLWYRDTCSQPLTCDVGGPASVMVSYYFIHYVPRFWGVCLVVLGAASLVVARRLDRRTRLLHG